MRILIDMNLSPGWSASLQAAGHEPVHWADVGPHDAPDRILFAWAVDHQAIVLSHDLDFGHLLALSGESRPSVVQLRVADPLPELWSNVLVAVLQQHDEELEVGALVTIDPSRRRVRMLPLKL